MVVHKTNHSCMEMYRSLHLLPEGIGYFKGGSPLKGGVEGS